MKTPKTAAEHLAEIMALHARIHALRSQPCDPFYRVFLDGAEQVIDWLVGTCPDGELPDNVDPLKNGFPWALVLVNDPKEVKEQVGGYVFAATKQKP